MFDMSGETDITSLLKNMTPELHEGEYVFCTVSSIPDLNMEGIIGAFKEHEGWTVILNKALADKLGYSYSYVAAWITLTVHSSLEAVGLTAAFSSALAKHFISCNVVAAYYHDHIFVAQKDAEKALSILKELAQN
jgi:uncharacterized protein